MPAAPYTSGRRVHRAAGVVGLLASVLAVPACATELASEPSMNVLGAADTQQALTVAFGPVTVAPGKERTQCVQKRLGNAEAIKVAKIHNQLFGVSHHLIVYRVTDPSERLEPYDCESITEALDPTKASTLMITQKQDETLEFPMGTAIRLDPDQMVRLEMHYVNPSDREATIEAHSTFYTLPEAEFQHEVGFLFAGGLDVDIAPGSAGSLTAFIRPPKDFVGRNFFAFTGHQHKLGTNVQVALGFGLDRPESMEPVYDVPDYDWSEATTLYHTPPKVMPPYGGFRLSCDWQNTTHKRVLFGTSVDDEMCAFWAYYYPSIGSTACLKGRATNDISICCPGHAACN